MCKKEEHLYKRGYVINVSENEAEAAKGSHRYDVNNLGLDTSV